MRELFIGDYIREKRLEMGITQEQLCEGICEPITVSRMENGKQMPAYNRIRAFLQRLGLPDDRFYALLSKNELEMKTLEDEITADIIRLGRAAPENAAEIRMEGLKKLEKLEKLADPDDRITRQLILSERATMGCPDGPYAPEKKIEMLMDAIRITCPRFDPEDMALGLYSLDEATIINKIALAYNHAGKFKTSIEIYRKLIKYIQRHYRNMSQFAGMFCLVSCNYCISLFKSGYYDDAMEIAETGRRVCAEYGHYQFLPMFLDIMGGCFFYKRDLEKCREYYRYAWCIYKAVGNDRDRLLLEQDAKKRLNLEFPF